MLWVGTLLGPEATRAVECVVVLWVTLGGQDSVEFKPLSPMMVLLVGRLTGCGVWGGRCSHCGGVFWLVFENCIVDASIFDRLCLSY
jgi:hypothetical protein